MCVCVCVCVTDRHDKQRNTVFYIISTDVKFAFISLFPTKFKESHHIQRYVSQLRHLYPIKEDEINNFPLRRYFK